MSKTPKDEVAVRREAAAQPAPRDMFARLRGEIDQLFDNFTWPGFGLPVRRGAARSWMSGWPPLPAADLVEHNGGFELSVELPGMESDDIDLRLAEGTLTVRAEREDKSDKEEGDYHLSERWSGTVQRTIALPEGIDRDMVAARFENGVLKVTLPKSEAAKAAARKIEVKAA